MSEAKVVVLYPHPKDAEQFEKDYEEHIAIVNQHMTRISHVEFIRTIPSPMGEPAYYMVVVISWKTAEEMGADLENVGPVAAHAGQISSGGAPVVMLGNS